MSASLPVGPQVRLRPVRVAAGLTLEQLQGRIAEHGVPITVPHLSNVECGHQRASERLLRAWALALGLSPLDVWMPPRALALVEEVPDTDETSVTDATTAA